MSNSHYRFLLQQKKPANRWFFVSTLLGIFAGLLIIAQSSLLALIIDHVALHHFALPALHTPLFLLLIILVIRPLTSFFREVVNNQTATLIKTSIRKKLFTHLMEISCNDLTSQKTGVLVSTLLEQIEAVHSFFADYLPQMIIAIVLPFIIVVCVWMQNWVAGAILCVTAPLIPLFMALIGLRTAQLNQENFKALSRLSAHFLDMLQGLTTLTLFNRAKAQTKNIEKISDDFRQKTMSILRIAFLSSAALELFSTISIALIAVYLGLGLLGLMPIGFNGAHVALSHALFILLLAPEFFAPLRQLGTFYHARAEALGAADSIIKLLEIPTEMKSKLHWLYRDELLRECASMTHSSIHIQFNHVDFSYAGHRPVLTDFNLTINPGECAAITGPSGTGKSTLLQLIAQCITPQSGKILINGLDLSEINHDHWQTQMVMLHQNPRLRFGTIEDNIRFAKPHASFTEIITAAKKAGVMTFANLLPHGLQTLIHENNAGLSGGQLQRIALARIILKDAPLILLDEPTAFLDKANHQIIIDLINEWRGQKTIIIATHDNFLAQKATFTHTLLTEELCA